MTAPPPPAAKTTAAAWMDRLSDRLGALIPGGSRLPPRHPVKVSLVMGGLGLIAGWLTVVMVYFVHEVRWYFWRPTYTTELTYMLELLPGCSVSGFFLIIPLAVWSNCRLWLACCGIPVTMFAHAASFSIWNNLPWPIDSFMNALIVLAISLLPVLLTHAVLIGLVVRRRVTSVIVWSIAGGWLCGLMCACLLGSVQKSIQDDTLQILVMASPPTTFYATLAICLGISIWDATPPPKFEPTEPL